MSAPFAKATSVTREGEDDGFLIEPGFQAEMVPGVGETRLSVSVPPDTLPTVHAALVKVLQAPLGFLYRQKVDRRDPKPQGAPPRDFVGLDLAHGPVLAALSACADLVYRDARCEVWIRGRHGDQIVLDTDGLIYCYPDDPAFRDALSAAGVPEEEHPTMSDRDYVKHWFHAPNDALEDQLLATLGLTEVPHRR